MSTDQEIRVRAGIISQEPHSKKLPEIFNLTKHESTWREKKMGVIEPTWKTKREIIHLLSFPVLPDQLLLDERAQELAGIAKLSGCEKAMIGGPAFFMSILEMALCYHGIEPVFAWRAKNDYNAWQFGGFVESTLVEKGWLDHAQRD